MGALNLLLASEKWKMPQEGLEYYPLNGGSHPTACFGKMGNAPGGTRTLNLSVRSALLYPIELLGRAPIIA